MSRPPPARTSRIRATTSGGCCTRRASRRGSTSRASSSSCCTRGSASRTPRTGRRRDPATCGGATSPARPSGWSRSRATCGRRWLAFVGKEAYRGAFGERPELGVQERRLGDTQLSCCLRRRPRMRRCRGALGCDGSTTWPVARPGCRGAAACARSSSIPTAACCSSTTPTSTGRGGSRPAAASTPARATSRRCAASCVRRSASRTSSSARSSGSRERYFTLEPESAASGTASTSCACRAWRRAGYLSEALDVGWFTLDEIEDRLPDRNRTIGSTADCSRLSYASDW